jgi:hypothetical protein
VRYGVVDELAVDEGIFRCTESFAAACDRFFPKASQSTSSCDPVRCCDSLRLLSVESSTVAGKGSVFSF